MGFLPPQIQDLLPWDNLQSFINDWLKGVQILADKSDPDADNSDKVITPGTQFSTPVFWRVSVHSLTHNYDDFYHAHGNAPYLVASHLTVSGSEVTLGSFTKLGKLYAGDWFSINNNASDKEYVDGLFDSLDLSSKMTVHNDGNHLILTNMTPGSNVLDLIPYDALPSYVYYQWETIDETFKTGNLGVMFDTYELTMNEDQPELYGDIKVVGYNYNAFPGIAGATKPLAPYSQPLVGMIENQDVINYYIEHNDSTNNYHTTQDGYDIYYGDNYYIIKPNSQPVTYNKVYNVLVDTVPDIDPTIKIPTYNDVKYPPEPPMPEIDSDDQTDGGDYGSAEFVRLYACTSAELKNLMTWMSGGAAGTSGTNPVTVPDNFNPMDQIIGLIGYPMEIETGVGDDTTFTFRNAANQTVNTGWATKTTMANDRLINFGTVDIPFWEDRVNGVPFLDYSATVECYVPFCCIMALDPQSVMGCTLTCKMWVDYATGDCSCIIYSNYGGGQHPVAYSSGNCGASQPMSSASFGQLQGARATASHKMSQAVLGGVKNLVTSTIGGARSGYIQGGAASTVGVPVGQNPALANAIQGAGASLGFKAGAVGSAIGSAIDLGVTLTQTNLDNKFATEMTKNSLGTSVSGNFGQQTAWHYFNRPYIKVTWPTPISKRVTKYGHTYGVPVYKDATVSEYTGYTIFNNVDVDGITGATPNELSAIKGYLETGVYINGGGE